MTRLKIALLAGGDSPEREIALQSAAQIEAALDHAKYDITVIDLHHRDWHCTTPDGRQWQVDKNDFSITIDGEHKVFDYALILIHGTPGEDGRLQGYLDMMGVPYSSCSMVSSVVTFDKITTKRTLAGRVNLARERFLRRGEVWETDEIVAEVESIGAAPSEDGSEEQKDDGPHTEFRFCCYAMMDAMLGGSGIMISLDSGELQIGERNLMYCPFCGQSIITHTPPAKVE